MSFSAISSKRTRSRGRGNERGKGEGQKGEGWRCQGEGESKGERGGAERGILEHVTGSLDTISADKGST